MSKKNVSVGSLLERGNHNLKNPEISQSEKAGIAYMIETILHESGTYEGFTYNDLTSDYEVVEGTNYSRYYFPSKKIKDDYNKAVEERKQDNGFRSYN